MIVATRPGEAGRARHDTAQAVAEVEVEVARHPAVHVVAPPSGLGADQQRRRVGLERGHRAHAVEEVVLRRYVQERRGEAAEDRRDRPDLQAAAGCQSFEGLAARTDGQQCVTPLAVGVDAHVRVGHSPDRASLEAAEVEEVADATGHRHRVAARRGREPVEDPRPIESVAVPSDLLLNNNFRSPP